MRLWHQKLIPYLDDRRLLGQHRECCALRGGGWGRKHSVVDYVFRYEPARLYEYHLLVMSEMTGRGFNFDWHWYGPLYRGKNRLQLTLREAGSYVYMPDADNLFIYPEHDDRYLLKCLDNLAAKGAPRRITHAELENGLLRGDVITAYSKQEAMLKHAVSGRGGDIWSIKSSLVSEWLDDAAREREYALVKEDF